MKKWLLILLLIPGCIVFYSCKNHNAGVVVLPVQQEDKMSENDPFVDGNKRIVQLENEEIALFIKRYKWDMRNTGTGLRIEITETTNGKIPKEGNTVTLSYTTSLLTGETVYRSSESGDKSFVVDRTEEISGLHEAVKLMKKGESARLIIPSHLAYGVSGDGNRIKGLTPLVMHVTLVDIQ